MIYSEFPDLCLKLSKIGFGGASLSGLEGGYGFGDIGEANAQAIITKAIDAGINVFDTAPIYGFNTSEIRLGKYLKANRDKVHLVSKAGISWHSSRRVNLTNEPAVVEKMLHDSLKNLQTDYIDFFMIHWPDPRVDIRYPLEVLKKAQDNHKIKYIGLCNTNQEDLDKSKEVCMVQAIQSECNLFNDPLSKLTFEGAIKMGWGTLDKGVLAGTVKVDSKFNKEDARSWAPWWKKSDWKDKVTKVAALNKDFDINSFDISVNYSLKNSDISLCGFKTPLHLERILESINMNLSDELIQKAINYVRD